MWKPLPRAQAGGEIVTNNQQQGQQVIPWNKHSKEHAAEEKEKESAPLESLYSVSTVGEWDFLLSSNKTYEVAFINFRSQALMN